MQCALCKDPVTAWDTPLRAHVVVTKDRQGHLHTHGELNRTEDMQEMLTDAREQIGLPAPRLSAQPPAEVVFRNRQRIGDALMFTCGVRDFKVAFPTVRLNVVSTAMHIFDHNPHLDRTLVPTEANTVKVGPGRGTNQSNRLDWHFANAYRIGMEDALDVHIQQGESRPDIWLTEEEYHAPRITQDPYWLITVNGEKGWGCKMYPFERWQAVIDQNPNLLFYQIGTKGDDPPRLQGAHVVDYVGRTEDKQTGIRELFKLFLNAEGSLGLVSMHMHLAGALYKPCVVIAGAREPVSFTRYAGHQYLSNDGCLPCADEQACWHCDIAKCTNLVETPDRLATQTPKCAELIEPEDVTRALQAYYKGGRLKLGQPSAKPKRFKNIVPTPTQVAVPEVNKEDSALQQRITKQYGQVYDFRFGGGSLTQKDWEYLESVLDTYQVKTVLEFGAGLSSLLFAEKASVCSFETMEHWRARVQTAHDAVRKGSWSLCTERWDGKDLDLVSHLDGEKHDDASQYDLAFVDGPSGAKNREHSIRLAAQHAKLVVVHDARGSECEQAWQQQYLAPVAFGPLRGGDRCALWQKQLTEHHTFNLPQPAPMGRDQHQTVRLVSTARGWGGCARSCTTIMQLLLDAGHAVEFVPFHGTVGSREYREWLAAHPQVTVQTDLASIAPPCDVLFVYADDFVWEFGREDVVHAFQGLQARRKVLMVNYRRGKIGELPWTRTFDHYVCLNSTQAREVVHVHPGASTQVLPPCTDLAPFFAVQPNYNTSLRMVRHNSQGDTKFAKDCGLEMEQAVAAQSDAELHLMPGPSFVQPTPHILKYKRNQPPIPEFLAKGNLFWYSLPAGYMDMGPRVILEAMAAGLPVLADNWGGAVDRVTPETGWLCDSKADMLQVLRTVTPEELKRKGSHARRRAEQEFVPARYMDAILGGVPCPA